MASELRLFPVLVPHGTPASAPVHINTPFPPHKVTRISWRVPPGPRGEVGWQITMGGVVVIPKNGGWIITDDEAAAWDLEDLPDSGAWQVTAYNTGTYDHTIYVTFHLDPTDSGGAPTVTTPGVDMVGTVVT